MDSPFLPENKSTDRNNVTTSSSQDTRTSHEQVSLCCMCFLMETVPLLIMEVALQEWGTKSDSRVQALNHIMLECHLLRNQGSDRRRNKRSNFSAVLTQNRGEAKMLLCGMVGVM